MKSELIKQLYKIADSLDKRGEYDAANSIDSLVGEIILTAGNTSGTVVYDNIRNADFYARNTIDAIKATHISLPSMKQYLSKAQYSNIQTNLVYSLKSATNIYKKILVITDILNKAKQDQFNYSKNPDNIGPIEFNMEIK